VALALPDFVEALVNKAEVLDQLVGATDGQRAT
jgi:hypothetical protein